MQKKENIETVSIRPDIRFFTLYALLNGPFKYRQEHHTEMTKERIELIDDLKSIMEEIDKNLLSKYEKYWLNKELHLWWYIYFTSICGDPPDFIFTPDKKVEHINILESIKSFSSLMSDFYSMFRIDELYHTKYRNIIKSYIDKYDLKKIKNDLNYIHEYMRIPLKASTIPSIIIIPLPFESHFQGYAANTGDNLYILESKGAQSGGLNIHEYLHFFVNSTVNSIQDIGKLDISENYEINKNKEYVMDSYQELNTFLSENIVRAIDHRIEYILSGCATDFDFFEAKGLSLMKYFYESLERYENDQNEYTDIYDFINKTILEYKI